MLLYWLQQRRRRKLLEQPFPARWVEHLKANMGHYAALDERERATLHELVQVFVAEKNWEGCGGLELTDEMRVTIAGQACLLILGHDHDLYRRVETILVYPSTVVPKRPTLAFEGHDYSPMPVLGEAHMQGPVILAWDAALRGGINPRDGRNLVYHEFAHKLDMLDGSADGAPALASHEEYLRWAEVCTREFQALRRAVERGRRTFLRDYGATNEAEFFAVATEHFFEQPRAMQRKHAALYDILRAFYRQDPATRDLRRRAD